MYNFYYILFSEQRYLHGDIALPIFSRRNQVRTSALYTVQAILDTQKDFVCSKHPTQVNINCSFVVDTSKLQDPEDTKCDDCGAWKQTKTATTYLTILFCDDDGTVDSVEGSNKQNNRGVYTLVRRHYTCKSSPDLSRHIFVLCDPSGNPKPNQLIQYRFSGKEHSVDVKPHGNSKQGARPYKRTCPSTMKDLEQEVKLHPPKRAVYKVDKKRGGILNATCTGDLPRNAMQASRIRCKNTSHQGSLVNSNDPMQDLVVKFKEQTGQPEQFIQSIRLVPDPIIVLFNKMQVDDLQQFCAASDKASVLGVDVTFNLGKFYVTVCAYQNFRVINEHGKHPVMVGPTLIHSSKDQGNFDILFQEVTRKKPSLATSLRAYGTDGEQALSAAAADAFPFATHLRCANHLKDNITTHLHKQLLPQSVVREILNDIFGTANEKGLIHSSDGDFNTKLKLLQKRWELLEKPYKATPVVYRWFALHYAPIIRDNMRSELLHDLGLEDEKYTQNNSESLNALVKRYVDFKKQDIMKFVNDLEECVREQQNEVNKAAIGLGRWTLSLPYAHLRCTTKDWFGSMSQAEKNDALVSLHESSPLFPTSSSCNSKHPEPSFEDDLSVSYTTIENALSEGQAQTIWRKAIRLLRENKVIKAPNSNPKTRWVSSDTSISPHVVSTTKVNPRRYVCDKQCIGWKTYNICAHCVATAEDNKELDGFLSWFAQSKGKECNLTNAVYHETYKHAGLKKPPRRKYGDATHLPTDQKVDRLALHDISNPQSCGTTKDIVKLDGNCRSEYSVATQLTSQPELHGLASPVCVPVVANDSDGSASCKGPVSIDGRCKDNSQSVGSSRNIQICSNAQNVGTVSITPSTSVCTQQLLPTSSPVLTAPLVSLLSSIVPQLSLPSLIQSLTPSGGSAPKTMQARPTTVKSEQPFFLTNLTNRVKKCSGCGVDFRSTKSGTVPNYILGHLERDWYPSNGEWLLGKQQNKYYHLLRKKCILQRCPLYRFPADVSNLDLSPTITTVPPTVKETLTMEFGLIL